MKNYKIILLLSYISIASASAVILNPALPHISSELNLANGQVEWIVSIFLVGYVVGQLIYGPIARRFGSVSTLRIGLVINLIGIIVCIFGGIHLSFELLLLGRLITALGSSVGLVCTFIILNHSVEPSRAKTALSFASISFALSVTLAIMIGGFVNYYSHWNYCFYVLLAHGVAMYLFTYLYQNETPSISKINVGNIFSGYINALSSPKLLIFAFIIGVMSTFSYCYTTAAPFITQQLFDFNSAELGTYNAMTIVGIIAGSFGAAKIINSYDNVLVLKIAIATLLVSFMIIASMAYFDIITPIIFFGIITLMYFITSFIYPAASHIASNALADDKASASAMMNFINMAVAVLSVSIMGYISLDYIYSFVVICLVVSVTAFFFLFLKGFAKE
ncbi:MFS transporter [Francisella salimarina]|uniref:Tetracycline resistance protein n=1 Tax=Francisella salimarina TaxID=2599927 RepID=A0AAJ4TL44_9GAMM|nr:MFS transporter [Francisella salimarina]QWU99387.1 MFS transporter [Francisella salimarina]